MTLSVRVATHLPYLRRYARAVTGTQTAGDAYVTAILEALIADISAFPDCQNDKVALFKLFSSFYQSSSVDAPQPTSPWKWEQKMASRLQHTHPQARQALLLRLIEEFTVREIAEILSVSEEKTQTLLEIAEQEVAKETEADILIIEDEPLIAMDIERLVSDLGHKVVGVARTKDDAVALWSKERPSMVLADIQLADGSSGIDAVNDILSETDIPVIFITAFPERLLTGERPEPAFLVTKPFRADAVKVLISQALMFGTDIPS